MSKASDEILLLTTGGTIDKLYFDEISRYSVGASIVDNLLRVARADVTVEHRELMRKDSLELDDADRRTILSTVSAAAQRRIIITHGTDTMTTTAAMLTNLPDKVVVLTGALAPARFAESDAAFNLGLAVAATQLAPPGVYIAMNGAVFPAGSVVKDRENGKFVRTDH